MVDSGEWVGDNSADGSSRSRDDPPRGAREAQLLPTSASLVHTTSRLRQVPVVGFLQPPVGPTAVSKSPTRGLAFVSELWP